MSYVRWVDSDLVLLKRYYHIASKEKLVAMFPTRHYREICRKGCEISGRRRAVNWKTPAPMGHPGIRDIAWAAGIFEGEGHITTTRNRLRTRTYAQAVVTQRDPWLIHKLVHLFGGSANLTKDGCHFGGPIWHWKLCGGRARGFLLTIFTLLSPRRQMRIQQAMGLGTNCP